MRNDAGNLMFIAFLDGRPMTDADQIQVLP